MTRPIISGIAVDTLLFSRVGVPLFHLYRVFDRQGTHAAFHGTCMRWMHAFPEESDAASLRRRHRRRAQDIAARLSRTSPRREEDKSPDVSSRPMAHRLSVSQAMGSTASATAVCSSKGAGAVRSHRTEGDTIQVLIKLALPQFGGLGNRSVPVRKPWMVSTDSPASPDPACTTDLDRSPSPCLNLDTLSSDDAEESVIPRDISVTVLCSSEDDNTPIGSDQVLWTCQLRRIREIGGRSNRLKNCGLVLQADGVYGRAGEWPRWAAATLHLCSGFYPGSPAAGQQAGIISGRSLSGGRTSCYVGGESCGDRAFLSPYDVGSTGSRVPSDDCL